MRKALLLFIVAAAAALGWGYWHNVTHASLQVTVLDGQQPLRRADLVFMDEAGQVLAAGRLDEPWGLFSSSHPMARDLDSQLRWFPTWAPRVRFATVVAGACTIERVPVTLRSYSDTWWLWWVPLPHIGGKPYSSFDLSLRVDPRRCSPA
jgi:hypothetical protein